MKYIFFLIAFSFTSTFSFAQISGNEVYNNSYNRNNGDNSTSQLFKPVIIRDSIMNVSASVLLNVKADSLVVTLGLSQEAKTIKEANLAINKRLGNFKAALKGIGINESDTYVDFITQTKVYDYTMSGGTATQFIKGFEIKKNVIIKMAASGIFDRVIEAASEQEVYDIVKVDYTSGNIQKIYEELLAAASAVIKQKKDGYMGLSPVELLPVSKITAEKFFAVYPGTQYKEYEAFESSDVTTDYTRASLIKKVQRKAKTFYYDKIDQSAFDLVINNASPVVGIQYVLTIQMQYDLKKK